MCTATPRRSSSCTAQRRGDTRERRRGVRRRRSAPAGAGTVAYAELPNAHHAFDTLATVRSQLAADAVADFLGIAYGRRQLSAAAVLRHAGHAG